MSLTIKNFAYGIVCAVVFGLIIAILSGVRDSDGNTGLNDIFASKVTSDTREYGQDADFQASDKALSTYKPVVTCNEAAVESGITHGTTVLLSDIITATEDADGDGENIEILSFDRHMKVHDITDSEGNLLPGFTEGDESAVFPKRGVYMLTVTAEYQKGCSSRAKLEIVVKK